jgi:hypothetical protein
MTGQSPWLSLTLTLSPRSAGRGDPGGAPSLGGGQHAAAHAVGEGCNRRVLGAAFGQAHGAAGEGTSPSAAGLIRARSGSSEGTESSRALV